MVAHGELVLVAHQAGFLAACCGVSTEGHDDEAGRPERVNLAYGFECPLTQHEAIDTLSLGKRWSVCFYILEDDLRPIATFIPGIPRRHGTGTHQSRFGTLLVADPVPRQVLSMLMMVQVLRGGSTMTMMRKRASSRCSRSLPRMSSSSKRASTA